MDLALLAALVLGLKHATDPDHLTALSTLALSEQPQGTRRTGALGLAWGLGHGTTLLALGLPLILLGRLLPEQVQRGTEALVGLVIMVLALRLIRRWWRGYLHVHPHRHPEEGIVHAHPHFHENAPRHGHPQRHRHCHPGEAMGHPGGATARWSRSPALSFGIGLLHGIGGSAGATMLLLAAGPDPRQAAFGLVVFALGTALVMGAASAIFGWALTRRGVVRRLEQAIPWVASASCAFGAWYAASAFWP